MSRSHPQTIQLRSVGSQQTQAPLSPQLAVQNPSSHSWASLSGPPPWGLGCLLALQHILVLASLLCASHLLLLRSLPPGGLSYSPAHLLASSLFACGVSTILQTWMGSRLPLVQAPSFEFLVPALVLTNQKLPLAFQTPGNCEHQARVRPPTSCPRVRGLAAIAWSSGILLSKRCLGQWWCLGCCRAHWDYWGLLATCFFTADPWYWPPAWLWQGSLPTGRWPCSAPVTGGWPCCTLILLMVVCSQHLGSCQLPPCPWRPASPCTRIPAFRLLSVLVPVACVWIISALLSLSAIPLELSAPTEAPWLWLPHPTEWVWPLLTPRALAAGISMALATSISSLSCYALCGWLLHLPSLPPHACSRGLSLEGLGSVLAGLLGSPIGTASSFPNVGTVSLIQSGSQRVAYLVGLLCVGLGLSPRLAHLLTTIPLPVLGGVLGMTQAVVLSTGFSNFHLADIDSGRNVFIVGFTIFMALLLPRWLREAPVLLSTGWSPLDVLLHSLLTEHIFLAGLLGFLLENTIPGTRLERGLGQGLPSPFTAQEAWMPQNSREKAPQEHELPFLLQNLCPCVPQLARCLCPLPEEPGIEEGGPAEPGETADLLPGFGEQCPRSSREELRPH
ncbi:solute carrier family 23 member 3 isoform X2 [Pipistrellus kuhlii]|uniref:solute carrier family 23 member 3 isoform X2 n=1 Tax=Pipistrellus kuhlii TaxID=59472 RepID=UPI001E273A7E|nr:solute carrier family 23 member 3 isoform X2 [Pipistrellus kuhlii]